MGIEMMLNTPLPFPYVHLVSLLVHSLAIFSCIRVGFRMGTGPDSNLTPFRFATHCFGVMALNALYAGLLCLTVVLTNPFTDECVDFPAANFQCRMWKQGFFSREFIFPVDQVDADIYEDLPGTDTSYRAGTSTHLHSDDLDDADDGDDADADDADGGD